MKMDMPALDIVLSAPDLDMFEKALIGKPSDATHIIQSYIANGLATRGHNLTFLTPTGPGQIVCTTELFDRTRAKRTWSDSEWFNIASRASWYGQRKLHIPYLNIFDNYRLYDAALQCLPGKDLVYERNSLYRYGIAKACKRLGIPYVMYIEADDILEADIMNKPITGLLRWRARAAAQYNLNSADCIVCVSEPLSDHLQTNWNTAREKIVVFPNVADVQRFRPDPEAGAKVRASMGVNSQPLIVFVGNFYEWHDVTTLLNAFAQIMDKVPDARLILVGDGSQREAMTQVADELGLNDVATFLGRVAHDEVPNFLSAADIAVVPYPPIEEQLWLSPLKLFEYMASGTAVIASDIGQITQVIKDGVNGLLVPPGDSGTLSKALLQLIEDPVLRSRLARQAREDAVKQHSWEQYLTRLERVFRTVLDGKPITEVF